ncbi:MAG: VOC family protein [Klebsiella michiganensis]|uniref:2-oxoadipate dioxygenase/decarboxylase HglS n=1 Tax=Klebsiella michiganensis TaxID=1134687 RepID=UPI002540DCA3|nr:VOC family protein [Klebsiella michiganensis]MDK3049933.1 VOC family protein [Klebsiella michiganensis]MDU2425695.1 VOC family protein [Klebsiella michiganensis]
MANTITADEIRESFSQAMSAMYQQEVPQYGTLLELVADVNLAILENNPTLHEQLANADELARLNVERHGAIRVGTAEELATLRRMFAIMGMYPVSYYDLSQAGVPVHSTAFRPIDDAALARNPFRVFTSLLRLELIANEALRQRAADILSRRDIFTPRCRELIALHAQKGEFTAAEAREFVQQALETFRWHRHATVDEETYHALHEKHRLIADVVCFPGCHINHLTPRTLDIDRVQALMPECGIAPKALIEGPPRRDVPILLRQTSFKALEEPVMFAGEHRGTHTARFGEIEQRGIALTPKGRALYDRLLGEAGVGKDNLTHQRHLQEVFSPFPDSEFLLRQQGLAYFRYRLTPAGEAHRQAFRPGDDPQPLIERGWVIAQPIIYEDFLPVSAAGIFQSNLGNEIQTRSHGNASRQAFEEALGCPVYDEFALYQQAEERSKRRCGLL